MESPQREPPGRPELKAVRLKAGADHLGAALIQPGGSRYERKKRQIAARRVSPPEKGAAWRAVCEAESATRVEPRSGMDTSLAMGDCKGFFMHTGTQRKNKKGEKMGLIVMTLKKLTKRCFEGEMTMPKVNFWMAGTICFLAGIVLGLLSAPMTHGIRIGCNNGNNSGNTGSSYRDKKQSGQGR